jgi:hypothetical protein
VSEDTIDRKTFVPGASYGVFGEHVTLLLPPSEGARVASLWQAVDGGAGFDEVLDGLLVTGLAALPGFVLVGRHGDRTRVLVRGAGRVRLTSRDGEVVVHADGAATWTERLLEGVTGFAVELEGAGAAGAAGVAGAAGQASADLAIVAGVARVGRVSAGSAARAAAVPAPVAPPLPDEPSAKPAPDPGPAEPDVHPDPEAPARSAAEPGPEEQPRRDAPDDPANHDGDTSTDLPLPPDDGRPPPGIPGQPLAPPVTARPVARLVLSTGEVVEVDRAILVGRAPEARRFASTEQPRLVTVPSPQQEISSTHLEVRPGSGADHGMAVVTDLGSTNGTVLVQPGLPPEDLRAGMAVSLIPGAILDLGDGVTIQTTNP